MNLIAFQTLNHETLSNIIGGGCSWKGAANAAVGGAVGGAASYGATCWW